MDDKLGQGAARRRIERAPGAVAVCQPIDVAARLGAGLRRGQEQVRAVRAAGNRADEQVVAAQPDLLPVQAAIPAAPQPAVRDLARAGRVERDVDGVAVRLDMQRHDRAGRQVIRDRLPGLSAVAAQIESVRAGQRAALAPLSLVFPTIDAGHADGIERAAVGCAGQVADAAGRPAERLPARGDRLAAGRARAGRQGQQGQAAKDTQQRTRAISGSHAISVTVGRGIDPGDSTTEHKKGGLR
ncbi:MAG: hypothetical protein BWY52_02967 [Chloroflexi bacterium ADurb.Bin325]|nr:MAG: hypothetical protein BWY52_02967 [Chloroflexi bacterium ADurb.Bin325]